MKFILRTTISALRGVIGLVKRLVVGILGALASFLAAYGLLVLAVNHPVEFFFGALVVIFLASVYSFGWGMRRSEREAAND